MVANNPFAVFFLPLFTHSRLTESNADLHSIQLFTEELSCTSKLCDTGVILRIHCSDGIRGQTGRW